MSNSIFGSFTFPSNKTDSAALAAALAATPASQKLTAAEFNAVLALLTDTRDNLRNGELQAISPDAPLSGDLRRRNRNGRLEIYENTSAGTGRWRRVTSSDDVRDVRDFLSDAAKTALETGAAVDATSAMQAIFADLGTTKSGRIFIPTHNQLLQISATCEYIGNAARAFTWKGEMGMARGADMGAGFKWVGSTGGTMFDLRGANNCEIKDILFHGNDKAKYELRLREYRNDDVTLLASSQNINVRRCFFYKPNPADGDSAMVAIGQATSGATFQASEYRFYDCVFNGADGVLAGWGIRALEGGNCKNFSAHGCGFFNLYRGIDTRGGYLVVVDTLATSIGYDRDRDSAVVYGSGGVDAVFVQGVGLESGDAGCKCRVVTTEHANTFLQVSGVYGAFATPADGYGIKSAGPCLVQTNKLGPNYKQSAMLPWAAATAYIVGKERHNDSGKAYRCITAGTSAGSGGPTGTGSDITDGTAHWEYIAPLAEDAVKLNVSPVSAMVINNGFTTQGANTLKTAPVYDNNNNLLTAGDYPRLSAANNKVWCLGNVSSGSGGLSGVLDNKLNDTISGWVDEVRDQILTDTLSTGVTVVQDVGGRYVVTVSYTAFVAAGAGDVIIGRLNKLHRINPSLAKVTAVFSGTGLSGYIRIRVGVQEDGGGTIDDDGVLTDLDAKTAAVYGLVDSEIGAKIQAKGGYISGDNYDGWIRAKLTVGAGLISNLGAGSVTFIIDHKRLGVA